VSDVDRVRFGDSRLPGRWWNLVQLGDSGCWEWKSAAEKRNYARFQVGGKMWLSHRYAYHVLIGPIPDGLVIDHLCRNPPCVNPAHLEAVTHRENTLRGNGACAVHARKTQCPRGHPYDEANTRMIAGGRTCWICTRKWWKETNARRRKTKVAD